MKKYMVNIFIIYAFSFSNILHSYSKTKVEFNAEYKVKKISEQGTVYVIDLQRNDSTFRVLTEHLRDPNKIYLTKYKTEYCKTRVIKVGECYQLKLDKLYEYKLEENSIPNGGIIHFVQYNGSNVEIKINQIIYTTNDLKGLCLVQSEK